MHHSSTINGGVTTPTNLTSVTELLFTIIIFPTYRESVASQRDLAGSLARRCRVGATRGLVDVSV